MEGVIQEAPPADPPKGGPVIYGPHPVDEPKDNKDGDKMPEQNNMQASKEGMSPRAKESLEKLPNSPSKQFENLNGPALSWSQPFSARIGWPKEKQASES